VSELHDLVGAARRDVLDDDAVARMRARLAAGAIATSATGAAAHKTARVVALKPLAFGALAVGLAAVALVVATHRAPVQTHETVAPSATAVEPHVVTVMEPADVALPVAVEPATTTPSALPQQAHAKAPRVIPSATATATTTPAAIAPSSPREGLLLLRARAVLTSDPSRALAFVREHAAEFPDSQLAPEREKIRALAEQNGAR
jgi:hypothetical protein